MNIHLCMLRAVNNFDDEEELAHHMLEKHVEEVERVKGPQVP